MYGYITFKNTSKVIKTYNIFIFLSFVFFLGTMIKLKLSEILLYNQRPIQQGQLLLLFFGIIFFSILFFVFYYYQD